MRGSNVSVLKTAAWGLGESATPVLASACSATHVHDMSVGCFQVLKTSSRHSVLKLVIVTAGLVGVAFFRHRFRSAAKWQGLSPGATAAAGSGRPGWRPEGRAVTATAWCGIADGRQRRLGGLCRPGEHTRWQSMRMNSACCSPNQQLCCSADTHVPALSSCQDWKLISTSPTIFTLRLSSHLRTATCQYGGAAAVAGISHLAAATGSASASSSTADSPKSDRPHGSKLAKGRPAAAGTAAFSPRRAGGAHWTLPRGYHLQGQDWGLIELELCHCQCWC